MIAAAQASDGDLGLGDLTHGYTSCFPVQDDVEGEHDIVVACCSLKCGRQSATRASAWKFQTWDKCCHPDCLHYQRVSGRDPRCCSVSGKKVIFGVLLTSFLIKDTT